MNDHPIKWSEKIAAACGLAYALYLYVEMIHCFVCEVP